MKVYVLLACSGVDYESDSTNILGVFSGIDGIKEKILEDFDRYRRNIKSIAMRRAAGGEVTRAFTLPTEEAIADETRRWDEARVRLQKSDISEDMMTNRAPLGWPGDHFSCPWDYYYWVIEKHELIGGDK